MSRLAVPAALMPAPKANTSVGMMSSPPATPSRLLTSPTARPKTMAAPRGPSAPQAGTPGRRGAGRPPRPAPSRSPRGRRGSPSPAGARRRGGPARCPCRPPTPRRRSSPRRPAAARVGGERERAAADDERAHHRDEADGEVEGDRSPRRVAEDADEDRQPELRAPKPDQAAEEPYGRAPQSGEDGRTAGRSGGRLRHAAHPTSSEAQPPAAAGSAARLSLAMRPRHYGEVCYEVG